ncbi:NnrS family protein [Aquabacterium humicola]|uniref:NnrS family protein n=1 Tax=Aquabacterium humicola TaxID=3237377 RepID=UPI00254295D4|nr:NnrS family protein [Rubrivivax pictus]
MPPAGSSCALSRDSGAWRFAHLLRAPHRLAFAAGALLLALSALWWAALQWAGAEAAPRALPPSLVHGLLMSFGFMPLFFAGFLFTAGPKWLGRPAVPAAALLPALLPMLAGWIVFLLAAHGRDEAFGRSLGAIGLSAVLLGWTGVLRRFGALLSASEVNDRLHARLVLAAGSLGAAAIGLAAWGIAAGELTVVRAATQLGLWGFIGGVFVAAGHRMIPFFSGDAVPALAAWRPQWLLAGLLAVLGFEGLAGAAEALQLVSGRGWAAVRAAVELPAGLGLVALAIHWRATRGARARLLVMLHAGFSWLGVALLLFGLSNAVAAALGEPSFIRLAALHAFTMGFLGTTMFTMVGRISTGHGGRIVAADDPAWRLFWLLQAAIVMRLAAALVAPLDAAWGQVLLTTAALAWAGACIAWALRYGRWYGTPRPDGRAG